ncbi:hydantoinase B/oxoprolinase family protein [Bordetella petrii]|nr:hydantoinase B/oxoprolinase family protein [Bordetella petrii]
MDSGKIAVELLWRRLITAVDEAAISLVRTSFSSVVRDFHDYACAVFDEKGRLLAQSTHSTPGLLGILPHTVPNFLKDPAVQAARDGDIFVTNDPWLATGHLIDITIAMPAFIDGRLVGYVLVVVHHMNVGGRVATLASQSVYEEGLKIPILRLYEKGAPNETAFAFIRANVLEPEKIIGDLRAQVASAHTATRRLKEIMSAASLSSLEALGDEIISRSERSMRQAIRKLPQGTYSSEFRLEGVSDYKVPLTLKLSVTVRDGEISLDFSGTSGQIPRAVNVTLNMTRSYSFYPLKCLLDPDIPNNEGCLIPISIEAPEGSLLNATFPAATWGRTMIAHMLPELIMQCLGQVIPESVLAGSGATPLWYGNFHGRYRDGRTFYSVVTLNGGLGARHGRDGISSICYPANVANIPVEMIEAESPLQFSAKEFAPDSAGAGRHQGGFGQRVSIRVDSAAELQGPIRAGVRGGRLGVPILGMAGGENVAIPAAYLNGREVALGTTLELHPGDELELSIPGGGGYGDPAERAAASVRADLDAGLLTPERALSVYPQAFAAA